MSERVTVTMEKAVAEVRMVRPDKLNALDLPMFDALIETGDRLRRDPKLRAVVLCGEGRAFCAGLDMALFGGMGGGGDLLARSPESPANRAQRAAWIWTEVPVPVIAALQGAVFGGGLQIALAADIRIAAPDARLSVREIRWGLIPDMTGPQTLPRLVGIDVAKELTFTGREVSGTEARELGLVTRVSDTPLEDARALAREIARRNPQAIRAGKQVLDRSGRDSVEEGLLLEEKLQLGLIGGSNQMEAVRANLEKREPEFED